MQELLFHYSLGQQSCSSAILFHSLNELSERLDRLEPEMHNPQRFETMLWERLSGEANGKALPEN
jgi:hypothetical protein